MSSRRTTTLGALTAVAGLSVGLLTATAPASQAAIMGCPTSTVCLYTGNWFTGETQHISGYSKYANLNSAQHDNTTSWLTQISTPGWVLESGGMASNISLKSWIQAGMSLICDTVCLHHSTTWLTLS